MATRTVEKQPDIYLNVFNSGFLVNLKQIEKNVLKVIEKRIEGKRKGNAK